MHSVTSNAVFQQLDVVSRTVCTPFESSTKFNPDDIDCLTDCKYKNGLHHVSGLIIFNPSSTQHNGFYLSATPSRIIGTGNFIWVNGATHSGTSVMCLCSSNIVTRWGGDTISTSQIVCFDFWYKE